MRWGDERITKKQEDESRFVWPIIRSMRFQLKLILHWNIISSFSFSNHYRATIRGRQQQRWRSIYNFNLILQYTNWFPIVKYYMFIIVIERSGTRSLNAHHHHHHHWNVKNKKIVMIRVRCWSTEWERRMIIAKHSVHKMWLIESNRPKLMFFFGYPLFTRDKKFDRVIDLICILFHRNWTCHVSHIHTLGLPLALSARSTSIQLRMMMMMIENRCWSRQDCREEEDRKHKTHLDYWASPTWEHN